MSNEDSININLKVSFYLKLVFRDGVTYCFDILCYRVENSLSPILMGQLFLNSVSLEGNIIYTKNKNWVTFDEDSQALIDAGQEIIGIYEKVRNSNGHEVLA